jgi:hypothetical protein
VDSAFRKAYKGSYERNISSPDYRWPRVAHFGRIPTVLSSALNYHLMMPAHSSHLLQPLDVGCFSPLKISYGKQIEKLVRLRIHHITKLEFLPAFKEAFQTAFTEQNIKSGFRATGNYSKLYSKHY